MMFSGDSRTEGWGRVPDQLTITMISGGVALLVALLGIAGAIAAQVVATRRAFANSLELFERQASEAQRAREEATRVEDRQRFADQRRAMYSRILRMADELVVTRDAERNTKKNLERAAHTLRRVGDQSESMAQTVNDYESAVVEHRRHARRIEIELAEATGEIHLLSDHDVRTAVDQLRASAQVARYLEDPQYVKDRQGFLLAARRELGVELPRS
jgi:hypothetical protein